MRANNFESGSRTVKREIQTTAQEDDVMSRYVDLRASAYNAQMSDEERSAFAQNLIDTVKILNRGEGIDPDFREEMLKQIRTIDTHYTRLKEVAEAVHRLERESRGGVLVPHLYEKTVGAVKTALESGVPVHSLASFQHVIQDYLYKVQSHR